MTDFHPVVKGENLTIIAKKHGTTVYKLLELNPELKKHPNLIFPNDKIKLPESEDMNVKGLYLEREESHIPKVPWQEGYNENERTLDSSGSEKSLDTVKQNTTLGAVLTLGAKGYVKRNQIKGMKPAMAKQFKSAKGKVVGKIMKAKAQNVRNTAAEKIRDARKANANLKAEEAKLKELRTKQAKVKAAKSKLNKLNVGMDAKGNKITDKKLIEIRKVNKKAGVEKANKEIQRLQKEIDKQMDKVGKAKTKKVAAKEAAAASKRLIKNIPGAGNAARKTARKVAAKAAEKTTAKAVTKATAKAAGKTALKKIPFVGLAAGMFFAADRALHGDFVGAGMEAVSGAASCIPGVGTAASVAIDMALGAKDLHDQKII